MKATVWLVTSFYPYESGDELVGVYASRESAFNAAMADMKERDETCLPRRDNCKTGATYFGDRDKSGTATGWTICVDPHEVEP